MDDSEAEPYEEIVDLNDFDELPAPHEVIVERSPAQTARLVAAILGAGIGAGLLVTLAVWFFGGLAQTEAGLCRVTWAPCSSLSLSTVEQLSGVDLPEGAEVVSGYAQESGASTVFRAEIVLPSDASVALDPPYELLDGQWPELVPAVADRDLADLSYWWIDTGDQRSVVAAVLGTDEQGRSVILFDSEIQK